MANVQFAKKSPIIDDPLRVVAVDDLTGELLSLVLDSGDGHTLEA